MANGPQFFNSPQNEKAFADLAASLSALGADRASAFRLAHERISGLGLDALLMEAEQNGLHSASISVEQQKALRKLLKDIHIGDAAATIFFRNQFQVDLGQDSAQLAKDLQTLSKENRQEFVKFAGAVLDAARSRDGDRTGLTGSEFDRLQERLRDFAQGSGGESAREDLAQAIAKVAFERVNGDATFKFRLAQNLSSPESKEQWANLIKAVEDLQKIVGLIETTDSGRSITTRFVAEHRPGLEALERAGQRGNFSQELAQALARDLKLSVFDTAIIQENKFFKLMAEALERFAEAHRERKAEEKVKKELEVEERHKREQLHKQIQQLEDKVPFAMRELLKRISPDYFQIKVQHEYEPRLTFVDGLHSDYGSLDNQLDNVQQILDAVKLGTVVFELSNSELEALSQYLLAAKDLLAERVNREEAQRQAFRTSFSSTANTATQGDQSKSVWVLDE